MNIYLYDSGTSDLIASVKKPNTAKSLIPVLNMAKNFVDNDIDVNIDFDENILVLGSCFFKDIEIEKQNITGNDVSIECFTFDNVVDSILLSELIHAVKSGALCFKNIFLRDDLKVVEW